jgi:branched-chain amino acid transport system permease protein
VALILGIDGWPTGRSTCSRARAWCSIFSVTRVVFVPFGDIAAFAALSLAAFETGRLPATIGMIATLSAVAVLIEATSLLRRGESRRIPKALLMWGVLPALPCLLAWGVARPGVPAALHVVSAVLLVVPVARCSHASCSSRSPMHRCWCC